MEMKTRKWIVLLLCLSMLLTLMACDGDPGDITSPVREQTPSDGNEDDKSSDQTPGDDDTKEPAEETEPEYVGLSDIAWTSEGSATEAYEIKKDAMVSIGNGSYFFEKNLTVIPAAGDAEASAVEITYEFTEKYRTFISLVGVADSTESGSVEFLLYVDDTLRARSGEMKSGEYLCFNTSVHRAEKIKLVVTNFDGDNTGDMAVWAVPTLFSGYRIVKPEAALPDEVDYYIDEMDWLSATCLHSDTKGAPFIDKNENGGTLSMGSGFFKTKKGIWLHPYAGEDGDAELVIDLTLQDVDRFVATFGLSDEYVGAVDNWGGVVDVDRRSVQFIFLIDDVEVASYDFINSVKLGTVSLDVSGASKLTIRMTNYNGIHSCDAGVISGGFLE